jgi:hypothetical protein
LPVRCIALCTPGMGVNLWGASPLYVNPVNAQKQEDISKSISRRQGRNRGPNLDKSDSEINLENKGTVLFIFNI